MNDVYISVDIEADGPIPGEHSMFQLGATIAGRQRGTKFESVEPGTSSFLEELRPLGGTAPEPDTMRWIEEHDLPYNSTQAKDPSFVMKDFARWVEDARGEEQATPVFVAYPLSFDWMFTHYYFHRFLGFDPFGFSSAVCLKSMYFAKSGQPIGQCTKSKMKPNRLTRTRHRHTHDALDDAKGQADLFVKLRQWEAP